LPSSSMRITSTKLLRKVCVPDLPPRGEVPRVTDEVKLTCPLITEEQVYSQLN